MVGIFLERAPKGTLSPSRQHREQAVVQGSCHLHGFLGERGAHAPPQPWRGGVAPWASETRRLVLDGLKPETVEELALLDWPGGSALSFNVYRKGSTDNRKT